MNLDERLAALAETDARIQRRHEALAETVEIVAGMQRENEKQIAELAIFIRQLAEIAKRHEDRLDDLDPQ